MEKNIKSLHWNNNGEAIKIREFMDKIILKSESDLSDRLPTNIDKKNRSFVILRSDDPLNPSPCTVSDDSGKLKAAYVAKSTKSNRVKIDGFLYPNFM